MRKIFDEFDATLKLSGIQRGGHRVRIEWVDPRVEQPKSRWRRETFDMFPSCLVEMIQNNSEVIEKGCVVTGRWGYCKMGTETGLVFVGPSKES